MLDGLASAFAFFGKVPFSVLLDNTSLAVVRITPDGVRDVLAPIWHTKAETAEKALARLRICLRHATALGLKVDLQAADKARALLGKSRHKSQNIPAMPWQEVPAFYASLRDGTVTHLGLRLLILTGARSGPLRFIHEGPIEGDVWTIPAEAMKGRRGATTDFRVASQRTEEPSQEAAPVEKAAETPDEAKTEGERPRDAAGRFAAKEAAPAEPEKAATKAPDQAAAPVKEIAPAGTAPGQADDAAPLRPPPGWSPTAKAEFDKLPQAVREAVAKREADIDAGFRKYSGLDQFVRLAEQGGTTLPRAIENYVGIEQLLRRDIFAGVEQVLRNAGTNTHEFVQHFMARAGDGTQSPPNAQQVQAP